MLSKQNPIATLIALILVVVLPYQTVLADETGDGSWKWLKTLSQKAKQTHYQGVFVHSVDGRVMSMSVSHGNQKGEQHELLQSLDGKHVRYVRRGNHVVCTRSEGKPFEVKAKQGFDLTDLMANRIKWRPFYSIKRVGKDRVAGRTVSKVLIKPNTPDRYAYALWLDRETGVLLKYQLLKDQSRLENFQFTQFDVLKDYPQQLSELVESKTLFDNTKDEVPRKLQVSFEWLPPGFSASNEQLNFYSDGIASFSVFVDSEAKLPLMPGKRLEGATTVVSKVLNNGHSLTLVGELPIRTISKIAENSRFVP